MIAVELMFNLKNVFQKPLSKDGRTPIADTKLTKTKAGNKEYVRKLKKSGYVSVNGQMCQNSNSVFAAAVKGGKKD